MWEKWELSVRFARLGGLVKSSGDGRITHGHGDNSSKQVSRCFRPAVSAAGRLFECSGCHSGCQRRRRERGGIDVRPHNTSHLPLSSSGLGHSPLKAKTGVRVPLGAFLQPQKTRLPRKKPRYLPGFLRSVLRCISRCLGAECAVWRAVRIGGPVEVLIAHLQVVLRPPR